MTNTEKHKIGLVTATIVGMNAMIGSGIFTIPPKLAINVGPAGILTTILVAIASWFIAISIARVATLFPQEGSFYIYAKQWGGHITGIISSSAYLVGLLIAMGFLTQIAAAYLHDYFPNYSLFTLGSCALLTLIILNMIGVVFSKAGQYVIICCTLFPLIATIIICATKVNLNYLTPFAPHGFTSVFTSTKDVIFAFLGFEATASLFSIVKDPEKNVPRAITYSLTIVAVLYILFISAILLSLPTGTFTDAKMPITDGLLKVFPTYKWIIDGIHIAILSALLGVLNAIIWSGSKLFLSLVKNLKNNFAKRLISSNILNTKTSVLFIGSIIFISFSTLKTADLFFSLTALFVVFAYISAMITLLTIKEEWKSGQNVKTVIGLITASVIIMFAAQNLFHEIIKFI